MYSLNYPPYFKDERILGEVSDELLNISSVGFQVPASWNLYAKRPKGRFDWQIIYIHDGYGYFQYKDTVEKIGPNAIIVFKPAEPQQYIYYANDAPWTCYTHFSGTIIPELLNKFHLIPNPSHNVFVTDEIKFEQIKKSFVDLKLALDLRPGENHFCWGNFIKLLSTISSCIKNDNNNSVNKIMHKQQIQTILKDIDNNYHLNKTLEDYAAMVQMSPSHFSHVFKSVVEVSPIEYRKKVRIDQSKFLLRSTDMPIKEISEHVGYPDPSLFIKRFKSLVGVTPYQYRHNLELL